MTRTTRGLRLLALGTGAGLAAASLAIAATPESGTVGNASPKVQWAGEVTSSGVFYDAWAQDPTIDCQAPACDPFALKVAEDHNVTLKLNIQSTNADGSDPGAGIRIKFPDGSYQYTQGTAGEKTTMTVKLKNLKAGDYEVTTVASHVCCGTDPYTESAEIPELAGAPAPAPAPASPTLTVKAPKASARKLAKSRKYVITASSNGTLNNVTALLLKGKAKLGSGKLATLNGTAKITLKVSNKIKKGSSYTVAVSGVDSSGNRVTTGVKVKLVK